MRKKLARLIERGAGGLPVPRFFMRKGRRGFYGQYVQFCKYKNYDNKEEFFRGRRTGSLGEFHPSQTHSAGMPPRSRFTSDNV